jgi:5-methylthioadenosine/S-adenosylhomocysteine deaminase
VWEDLGTGDFGRLRGEIGSLVVGKKADLVVFDFRCLHLSTAVHLTGTLRHTGLGRDVERVMVDGRRVGEHGMPVCARRDAILVQGQKAANALWARAVV